MRSKRLLATLLTLTMVVSGVPSAAIAAETEAPAQAEEQQYNDVEAQDSVEDGEAADITEVPAEEVKEEAPVQETKKAKPGKPSKKEGKGPRKEAVQDEMPEQAEEQKATPSVVLENKKEEVNVYVDAPEGALFEDTELKVEAAPQSAIDALQAEYGKDAVIQAVDISFVGEDGEYEPMDAVNVKLESEIFAEASDYIIVHIKDDGTIEEIGKVTEVKNEDAVEFVSDQFSVYAIIASVVIEAEEGSFDFETDEYQITVSYTKEANIPLGTELIVSQIPFDSEEYWDLWKKSLSKINENAHGIEGSEVNPVTRKGIAGAAFFDITLMNGNEEFEPEVPLQVEIRFKEGGLPLFNGQDAMIIHFAETGTKGAAGTELIEDVDISKAGSLAKGMPAGVAVDSFTYDQLGFSVVGAITTDDYINFEAAEYVPNLGDVRDFSSKMLLAAAGTRAAGDPTINAGKTVTDTDGDGIYELALSVQATSNQSSDAKVTKSNVVMVIDVSGSMGNDDSWIYYDTYTYNASTYANFRYYNSSSNTTTRLYYGQFRTGGYGSQVRTGWYYGGNTYNGNVYNATAYNGTVYAYETRLHATQRAACEVVDALLAYNNNADNITDVFEITVVKFANLTATGNYNGTETVIKDSTNANSIKAAINGLTSGGGTNWEAALNLALTEANYFKNTDPSRDLETPENTSVIFLTDGFPTLYVNNNGSQGGDGGENNSNISTSYTQARPSARNIVSAGFKLYNIFAFGSDTTTYNNHTGFAYLRGLTNYAYGSGTTDNFNETANTRQYCFNAKSTDDLVAAFKTIIDHITNQVGYAGVDLTDGVSLGATSTTVAVNGTANADSMRYTVKDSSNKIAYTVDFKNGTATFTIYNSDGTTTTLTDNSSETVTTNINGTSISSTVYSVTTGSGDNARTYKMSPATIEADTGMVKWDLAGLGILESGYTYTVAFDVWPNQLGYDIAADLNNGLYPNIEAALDAYGVTDETDRSHIRDAIIKNEDGSYSLYTNYEQSVEYYPATSETNDAGETTWTYGDKTSQDLPHPDPIPLKGSLLPMEKIWESDLSPSEKNELLWEDGIVDGTSKEYQITLYVWKADTKEELASKIETGITAANEPYITEVLGWDSESGTYVFTKSAAVAPGMMVDIEEAADLGFDVTDESKLKEFTNDEGTTLVYYVIEPGHYYEVTEEGSDLHFELETELYHPMVVNGTLYNVFFGDGRTVEKMDPMNAVTATNTLKGGLNISKVVSTTQIAVEDGEIKNVTEPVDDDGIETVTDEFTFEIKIWKEDENGSKSAVYTFDDQIKNGETISGSIGYRIYSEPSMDAGKIKYGGEIRGAILTEASPNASLAGDNFATISGGVTTITLTMPANGEIRVVNLPSNTKYTVKEIVDTAGSYSYAATMSQVKKSDDDISDGVVTTANEVNGTVAGNSASMEIYYNWASSFYVYHSSDNTIEKISFADERVSGEYDTEKAEYKYTFDIVDEVKTSKEEVPSYIYGGYYKAYGGQVKTDAQIKELEYDEAGWAKDDNSATPYTGSKATAWKKTNAYTEFKGTEMHPEAATVYYLKEVPNAYLRPYIQVVYDEIDNNKIKKLYRITAVDDANYKKAGFFSEAADISSTSLSATVKITKGSKTQTLTPKGVFNGKTYPDGTITLPRGYLTSIENAFTSDFDMQPYFITLDDVKVFGITNRTVKPGDGTFVIDEATGAGKLPGITTEDQTNVKDEE